MKRQRQFMATSGGVKKKGKANVLAQAQFIQRPAPLYRQLNTVKGGPEKKNHDVAATIAITAGVLTWKGAVPAQLLNGISEGATSTSRIGRKITMTKLTINWFANLQSTSVGGSPIRCMVYYDKQANTAASGILTVLNTDDFNSQMQLYNVDRFILVASFFTPPVTVGGNYTECGKFTKSIALEAIYNDGNSGTITDIQTGSLYIVVAQTANITVAGPNFSFISRLRFIDF